MVGGEAQYYEGKREAEGLQAMSYPELLQMEVRNKDNGRYDPELQRELDRRHEIQFKVSSAVIAVGLALNASLATYLYTDMQRGLQEPATDSEQQPVVPMQQRFEEVIRDSLKQQGATMTEAEIQAAAQSFAEGLQHVLQAKPAEGASPAN